METQTSSLTVDAVIPVYNGAQYIKQALDSVVTQTHAPTTIYVIDDGSTDGTAEIVKHYSSLIPIQYIHQENKGLSAARNTGIQLCTSTYVALLDADDVWLPNKLAAQLQVFQSSELKNLGLVYCQYSIIDGQGQDTSSFYIFHIDQTIRGQVFDNIVPANKIASSGSGVLIKRACFNQIGLFNESLTALEDWDMWLRIAQQYDLDFTTETLVKIRRHGQNMQGDTVHMFTNRLKFFDLWIQRLGSQQPIPVRWMQTMIKDCVERWPRSDFWQIMKQQLSLPVQQRVQRAMLTSQFLFFTMQMIRRPFVSILKRMQSVKEV